jgi:hypothetical protein
MQQIHSLPLPGVPRLLADIEQLPLEGIPAAPVKAPRTTQAERMATMGYQAPKVRPRCENCVNYETELLRCSTGNFPVQRGSRCDEWFAA